MCVFNELRYIVNKSIDFIIYYDLYKKVFYNTFEGLKDYNLGCAVIEFPT